MHHYNGPGGMRHDFMPHGMMNYTWVWLIGLALLIIIILVGIYLILKQLKQSQQNENQSTQENNALIILQERFAKGEISEDEYKQKRKILDEE